MLYFLRDRGLCNVLCAVPKTKGNVNMQRCADNRNAFRGAFDDEAKGGEQSGSGIR